MEIPVVNSPELAALQIFDPAMADLNEVCRASVEAVTSNERTECVLDGNVAARRIDRQPCWAGTRDGGQPTHAGQIFVFYPEDVYAICTVVGTDEKPAGRMEHDRMWMC